MPSLPFVRAAAVAATVAGFLAITGAATGSSMVVVIGGAAAMAAGVSLLLMPSRREIAHPAADVPAEAQRAPRRQGGGDRARTNGEGSILLATLRNLTDGSERLAGDLQGVLAGIVADERGTIDGREGGALTASFSGADHAGAAVQAARRMLSNVDAVGRRLGRDLRIAISVHAGPKGEETLAVARRVQEGSTESVPLLVSETAARHLGNQLELVDTLRGEGWQMNVFTFPPAQKRLPGL